MPRNKYMYLASTSVLMKQRLGANNGTVCYWENVHKAFQNEASSLMKTTLNF